MKVFIGPGAAARASLTRPTVHYSAQKPLKEQICTLQKYYRTIVRRDYFFRHLSLSIYLHYPFPSFFSLSW